MMLKNVYTMLVGASLTLTACTSRQETLQVDPAKQPAASNADQGAQLPASQTGATGFVLDQAQFKKYALDLNNLNYKFTYLTANKADKITFDASGKAQLKFTDLVADQAGTVTLEVLEGTTLKFRGTVDGVTLKKGENTTVPLILKLVDPNAGGNGNGNNGTTDLTIDVTLDNGATTPSTGGTGTGNGTGSGSGVGSGSGSGSGSGVGSGSGSGSGSDTPNTGGTGNTADPIATWDGKSNLGNSKWKVAPAVVGSALH